MNKLKYLVMAAALYGCSNAKEERQMGEINRTVGMTKPKSRQVRLKEFLPAEHRHGCINPIIKEGAYTGLAYMVDEESGTGKKVVTVLGNDFAKEYLRVIINNPENDEIIEQRGIVYNMSEVRKLSERKIKDSFSEFKNK